VLSFGEMWDLHLGGRYALLNQKTDGYEKSVFTPSAAVVFKPRPDLSVYVSYAEGLEQGGIAPTGTSNANQVLNPLVSRQWETGIKGELFGTVNWEASLFHISKAAEYTNSANIYVQDGEQVHKGLELSLSGKITPEWTLYGSAMFMDAKLKETGDPTTTGKRPPGVADVRTTLTAEYAPEALAGWVFAANWTHTGDRPVNAINTAIAPGYDIFGLGLRHEREIGGRDVTFRAGVDNLFDERYWANVDDDFLVQGSPRTIWASMSAKF
jgi:iron complex outermembrane recepter protein